MCIVISSKVSTKLLLCANRSVERACALPLPEASLSLSRAFLEWLESNSRFACYKIRGTSSYLVQETVLYHRSVSPSWEI